MWIICQEQTIQMNYHDLFSLKNQKKKKKFKMSSAAVVIGALRVKPSGVKTDTFPFEPWLYQGE